MPVERLTERVKRASPYIVDRLQGELDDYRAEHGSARGFKAEFARKVGEATGINFAPQTFTQVLSDANDVGIDQAEALARYWGMKDIYALFDAAAAWQKERESTNPRLADAIRLLESEFSRRQLNEWANAHNDRGWAKTTTLQFVDMIRKDLGSETQSLTADLSRKRKAAIKRPSHRG